MGNYLANHLPIRLTIHLMIRLSRLLHHHLPIHLADHLLILRERLIAGEMDRDQLADAETFHRLIEEAF